VEVSGQLDAPPDFPSGRNLRYVGSRKLDESQRRFGCFEERKNGFVNVKLEVEK
jgi:hypothetical protein